jgi:hypothetical protein
LQHPITLSPFGVSECWLMESELRSRGAVYHAVERFELPPA